MMLDARGWTQDDLSTITGWRRQSISSIVSGKTGITPEMAIALAAAFENDAADWLRWNAQYELALAEVDHASVKRKAAVFGMAPIRDMQKRGWIDETDDVAELEKSLIRFFGGPLDSAIEFPVAARRTVRLEQLSSSERAWCFRARQLARIVPVVAPFSKERLPAAQRLLRQAAAFPKEIRKVPRILSEHGIRFMVIEPLPGVEMQGASFWLDEQSPVIALSVQFDRIDAFWFTLFHEFKHIERGDAYSIDSKLLSERNGVFSVVLSDSDAEREANLGAADALVAEEELTSFIRRIAPLYSTDRIIQFAHRMKIHPGIIVGQLQHRGELGFKAHLELLVKVRPTITGTALTDGWGHSISPTLV